MRKNLLIKEMNKVIEINNRLFEKCNDLQKQLKDKQTELDKLFSNYCDLREENERLKQMTCEVASSETEPDNNTEESDSSDTECANTENSLIDSNEEDKDSLSDRMLDATDVSNAETEIPLKNDSDCYKPSEVEQQFNAEFVVPDDELLDIASASIGRVVMKCASICNRFSADGSVNAKDLINLALGRTEVFKSEVMLLVSDNLSIDMLNAQINAKEVEILEYFDLLLKQI